MPSGGIENQSRRFNVRLVSSSPLIQCSRIEVADFPVRRVLGAHYYIADLTLPYGRVAYDYNKEVDDAVAQQAAE
jgi:hypothetical protein